MDLRSVEQFVHEIVLARAAQAAGHDVTVGRAEHQAARHLQEVPAAVALEPSPQLVGSPQ